MEGKTLQENLFNLLPELYLIISKESLILQTTDQFLHTFNLNRNEVNGVTISSIFPEISKNLVDSITNSKESISIKISDGEWNVLLHPLTTSTNEVLCKFTTHSKEEIKTTLITKIADSFPGIIALYSIRTGEYFYVNKSVENILGFSREEIIENGAQLVFSLIHPDDVPGLMEENNRAITEANENYPNHKDDEVVPFEYRLKTKNGSHKWLQTYGIVFQRDKENKVEYILNFSFDITERKEKELNIRNSEQRLSEMRTKLEAKIEEGEKELLKNIQYYHFMADAIPGIFWTALPEGEMDYYSKSWEEFTGISREEAIQGAWVTVFHPDELQTCIEAVQKSIASHSEYKMEHRIRAKDGSYRWYLSRALPLKDEQGSLIKWFGTSFDIDDEKRALNLLQENENKYKFLANFIPQIVWTTDAIGQTEYLNKKWYDYTGMEPSNLDPFALRSFIHPDDLPLITNSLKNAVVTGSPFSHEYRIKSFNGEFRWFLCHGMPMKDNEGNIIKWFGTSTDIQYQKEIINNLAETQKGLNLINQELNNTNEELNKINIDLDNFIYTASHDLKAPISNIEGLINFLKKDELYYKGDVKEILDLMVESTERFKKTIAGLTVVAKIQKNTIDDVEEINFEDVLQEILKDINEVKSAGAIIKTDFKEQPYLNFSKKYIRSILYNLTSNAIKYRSPYRQPEIEIKTMADEHHTILIVKDNGLGLPQNSQDNVFKMFKRLHTHVEGTGIGLYIVKRIIDNAGGRIEIESEVNKGTTFKIYFKKQSSHIIKSEI